MSQTFQYQLIVDAHEKTDQTNASDDCQLIAGKLDLATGIATITCTHQGVEKNITLKLSMDQQLAAIIFDDPTMYSQCINQPAYVTTGDQLKNISFDQPTHIDDPTFGGFIQPFPNDPGIAVGYQLTGKTLWLTNCRGNTVDEMQKLVQADLLKAIAQGLPAIEQTNQTWWQSYWQDIPQLDLPNETLQFLYDYGMYKFACTSQPDGIACTLQGPWIEDDTLPPWSSDYHFNINVQMCYWPAYRGNRLSHLRPIFDLIFFFFNIFCNFIVLFKYRLNVRGGIPHWFATLVVSISFSSSG